MKKNHPQCTSFKSLLWIVPFAWQICLQHNVLMIGNIKQGLLGVLFLYSFFFIWRWGGCRSINLDFRNLDYRPFGSPNLTQDNGYCLQCLLHTNCTIKSNIYGIETSRPQRQLGPDKATPNTTRPEGQDVTVAEMSWPSHCLLSSMVFDRLLRASCLYGWDVHILPFHRRDERGRQLFTS